MRPIMIILLAVLFASPWVINGVKFARCDFSPDYKCEAIHGAGVFMPPLSYITVWFSDDSDKIK